MDETTTDMNEAKLRELEEKGDAEFLWKKIGYHRPLASFWWNYTLILVLALPALLVIGYVIPQFILPFPAALGFSSLTTQFFGLFFTIMDVATVPAVERFVAEYSVKNPRMAIKYIQFFVWFQMFTGLVQITGVAIYCFYFMPRNLEYAMWFFLIYSTTQYPGWLGSFNGALIGFQRFDKANKVTIIQSVFLQSITQIGFILLGRWIGTQVPALGELMGATYGFIIGTYLDDFMAMALSGYFFAKVLRPFGLRLRDAFVPDFDRAIAKKCLTFGGKLLFAHVINTGVNFAILWMVIAWLPNYAVITGLYSIADGIARVISISFTITPAISEAFNNQKKELTKLIVESQWKNWFLLSMFLSTEVAIFIPPVLKAVGGEYGAAAWMIPVLMISRFFVFPINFGSDICQGADKPEYRTYALMFEQIARFFSYIFMISPFGILSVIGESYAMYTYLLADLPAYLTKLVVQWWFVQKKTIKTRFSSPYQVFVAPAISVACLIPINLVFVQVFNTLYLKFAPDILVPLVVAACFLLLILFALPILLFFIYGLVGGWDDYQLRQFRNAMFISGPSKPYVRLLYNVTGWAHRKSKLGNRFPIDHEAGEREAMELTLLKARETGLKV
jgi:O-antigen/teichoic acid export membrane protein